MKFIVASRDNGLSKAYKVDDEHRWGQLVDQKIGAEIDGQKILGDAFKGYILRVAGGSDENGFAMKNGVLRKNRVRLLIAPRTCGLKFGREGERKRRSVRGAIIDRDVGCVHFTIVQKGEAEVAGLTDVKTPRRLGPKRANKIRKLFGLPRHFDRVGVKNAPKDERKVDRFDVTRYVVKRPVKARGDKEYYKAPAIQRLITAQRIRRAKAKRSTRLAQVQVNAKAHQDYIANLKAKRVEREKAEKAAKEQAAAPAPVKAAPAPAAPAKGAAAKPAATGKAAPAPAKPTPAPAAPAKNTKPADPKKK